MTLGWFLAGLAFFALGAGAMYLYMHNKLNTPSAVADLNASEPPVPHGIVSKLKRLTIGHMAMGAAVLAMLATLGIAFNRSSTPTTPGTTSQMADASGTSAKGADGKLDDVDTLISRLEERLQKNPNDGEGWRMLGWSYVGIGQPAKAVSAYGRARKLLPNRADVEAGYGEALVGATGEKITPEARAAFEHSLKLDPKEPRARFFMSLDKVQSGKEREGLDEWIALSNEVPAQAAWQPDLHQRINALAQKIGVDVSGKLHNLPNPAGAAPSATVGPNIAKGPTPEQMAAAQNLPADQQQGMVNTMVDGLANRLKANPHDLNGWIELIRSRKVLNQPEKAKSDLTIARATFKDEPASLAQLNAVAQNLGLN